MKKNLLALVFFTAFFQGVTAQQDAQFTQYMYNTIAINSAYAGNQGGLSMAGLYRSQWAGVNGAPKTQTFNIHAPIGRRVGLGLSIVNDEIGNGTSQQTYFDIAASYSITLSNESQLSFGIKAGGHLLNIDFTQLKGFSEELANGGIPNIDNKFSPNFGAGVYYHTDRFYAGFSIPNFLETKHFDSSSITSSFLARNRMNLYLITGYVFDLNTSLKFKPAILLKTVQGAPLQSDFSANFLINEKFSLGAAYRWDAAFSGLMGFQVSGKLMLGIAYDREITALGNAAFNNGSFEIFLKYNVVNSRNRVLTPRFF